MKTFLFAVLSVILISVDSASAQSTRQITSFLEQRGDRHYNNFAYTNAVKYYQEALKSDSGNVALMQKIARSFVKLNDVASAQAWFDSLAAVPGFKFPAEDCLDYARVLTMNNKPALASYWYEQYKNTAGALAVEDKRLESLSDLECFYADSSRFKLWSVSANSPAADFSPAWYANGIVFVSNRSRNPFAKHNFLWDNSNYLDIYYSDVADGGDLNKASAFNDNINSKYHEGPLCFFNNDHDVVFTRNIYFRNRSKKSEDGVTHLGLYFAKIENNGWSVEYPFVHNNPEYSVGHPAMSADGETLYFVSDMPGGFGGTDIYVSYFRNGEWTKPKNLGKKINSKGNEMFPSLSGTTLYFSSDGHPGLGGLDVYRAELSDTENTRVSNIGFPVSSPADDFSFITDTSGEKGYFSSNRDYKSSDDIFHFQYEKPKILLISGTVTDNYRGTCIAQAAVYVLTNEGDTIASTLTDEAGGFELAADASAGGWVVAAKAGYEPVENFVLSEDNTAGAKEIALKLDPPHHLVSIAVVDQVSSSAIHDAVVRVINHENNALVNVAVRNGQYHEFATPPNSSYTILGKKEGYFNNTIDISIAGDHEYDTLSYSLELREFLVGQAIRIDNIYYDHNKAEIRDDAAAELDKLVKLLVDNPEINIELSSHTDSKGSDEYNLKLSQRRADSAKAYVVSRGIDDARIQAKGYGESQLINGCANGVACSNELHQQNRRTEFKVIE